MAPGVDAEVGYNIHVDVRGMRKSAVGDQLLFIARAAVSDIADIGGSLMVMVKSA